MDNQYTTLLDIKKPISESELRDLWKNATSEDKVTFISDNLNDVHDRKFLGLVVSKFVATDKEIPIQHQYNFCLECGKEFGSQFIRNNLAAYKSLEKNAEGPWKRELSSILGMETPNLSKSDLQTLLKTVPQSLRNSLDSNADYWLDEVKNALEKKIEDKNQRLEKIIDRGTFLDLRWGDDNIFKPGRTYLGIALDKANEDFLKIFTSKGIQRVPLQWVTKVWPPTVLGPIQDWNKHSPEIPQQHPVNSSHWQTRFKEGVNIPLHDSVQASSQEKISWQNEMKPLISQLDELGIDQLMAYLSLVQTKIEEAGKKSAEAFKKLVPGTWVECKHLERVAYLGKSDNGKARVWLPDEDAIVDDELQKAIYRIPYSWIIKTLSEQTVRLDENGYPDHADLLKYSNEFKRHHHGTERKDLVKRFDDISLRKVSGDLLDWLPFWNEFRKVQSSVVKKRGDKLIQDFMRFTSFDPSLKGTSGKDYLKYQKLQPLKIIFVTDLIHDDQNLGSFVRAEFDLLENSLTSKDQEIQTVFRE